MILKVWCFLGQLLFQEYPQFKLSKIPIFFGKKWTFLDSETGQSFWNSFKRTPLRRRLQCDSCDSWIHTRCLGMNYDEYQLLANSSCSWICPDCDLPSFFSPTLLDLSSDTLNLSNSFDILSGSVVDNGNNFPRSNPATSSSKRNTKTKLKWMIIYCDGLKSSKHSTEFHLEALWSSLKIANRKTLYISSFYRPPNSSTEILDHLDDSLNNRQHNISKIESVQRRAARKMGFKNCAIQILIVRLQPTDSTELRSRTLEARQILEASSFLILSFAFQAGLTGAKVSTQVDITDTHLPNNFVKIACIGQDMGFKIEP